MSEYIVDIPESYPFKIVQDGWHYHVECEYQQREKIVRCRDCARCEESKVYGKWFCHRFSLCDRAGFPVEPDGFCSRGTRKEDA